MPRLIVHRRQAPWRDQLRAYRVVLDGATLGRVLPGKTMPFEIPAGPHALEFRVDWGRSRPLRFEAGEGDVIEVECAPGYSSFEVWAILPPWHRSYIRADVVRRPA